MIRLGVSRFNITPALRWYDWSVRVHYGEDKDTNISFINRSDPVFLAGLDLRAEPWNGALLRVQYAGFGARVHSTRRQVSSYDQYDARFDQNLWPHWRMELQGVYDERFEHSLCYYGGWLAYGWPMRVGEFLLRVGYVEQLDALLVANKAKEDPIGTVSIGFLWERLRRF